MVTTHCNISQWPQHTATSANGHNTLQHRPMVTTHRNISQWPQHTATSANGHNTQQHQPIITTHSNIGQWSQHTATSANGHNTQQHQPMVTTHSNIEHQPVVKTHACSGSTISQSASRPRWTAKSWDLAGLWPAHVDSKKLGSSRAVACTRGQQKAGI